MLHQHSKSLDIIHSLGLLGYQMSLWTVNGQIFFPPQRDGRCEGVLYSTFSPKQRTSSIEFIQIKSRQSKRTSLTLFSTLDLQF